MPEKHNTKIILTHQQSLTNCYNPGRSKAELLTWSGITIGKIPHHTTTAISLYLQFRAIQAIQYYVNCTVQRRTMSYNAVRGHTLYMDATSALLVKFYPLLM